MTNTTKLLAGLTFILLPTIELGGVFLLGLLSGDFAGLGVTELQQSLYRAGHGHAGVLVLLGLVGQMYADHVRLPRLLTGLARGGLLVGPALVSGGFFAAGVPPDRVGSGIALVWVGAAILAFAVVSLGAGLVRARTAAG